MDYIKRSEILVCSFNFLPCRNSRVKSWTYVYISLSVDFRVQCSFSRVLKGFSTSQFFGVLRNGLKVEEVPWAWSNPGVFWSVEYLQQITFFLHLLQCILVYATKTMKSNSTNYFSKKLIPCRAKQITFSDTYIF